MLRKVSSLVRMVTRSCAASVQRALLLLQWRGDGSRDALPVSMPLGTAPQVEDRRRWKRGAISLERLKDC